jgi:uncharacterized protein involved in exopolysaccharide biosynthesis
MEPVALFDVLRRHAWMIVVLCLAATVTGYALCFLVANRYTASALVLVRPQQSIKMGGIKESKEFLDFPMGSASVIETASKTYIELIKSPALISEVVRNLGLDKEKAEEQPESGKLSWLLPSFIKPAGSKSLSKSLLSFLFYGKAIEDDPFAAAVKEVAGNLSLSAVIDTYIFDVKYTAKDPERAAAVANMTAQTLIKFVEELRLSEARYQRDHLKTELEQRQKQVDLARVHLENYKKAHSVFAYESEYNAKLKVISELEVELAKAEATLVGGQNSLSNVSLAAKRARLIQSINELQAELASAPRIERELKQLEEEVKGAVAAYEAVDKEFKEADIKGSYGMPEARLVSIAAAPQLPSSPRRGTMALVSLFGGLIVAVGLAFFREYLNRRVRGIPDIEDFVGVKVLATIPRVSPRRWREAGLL